MAGQVASQSRKNNVQTKFQHVDPRTGPYDTTRPRGRSGHCMCSDDTDLYVFGGYSPEDCICNVTGSMVFPELWKFNFASQRWQQILADNTPYTCASASMAVVNSRVFVFGGTGYPFGQSMSNTIKTLKLDQHKRHRSIDQGQGLQAAGEGSPSDKGQGSPSEKGHSSTRPSWDLLETNALSYTAGTDDEDSTPRPAYGQTFVFHKDAIYVFAGAVGYYSEPVADLHRLSLSNMTWEKLHPSGQIPSGRYKQELVRDTDRFYVLGGGRLHHAESLEKVYAYDYSRNHWTEICTEADGNHGFPKPRCSFGCAQVGRSVYISGGRHYSMDIDHEPLADMWHLCLDTMKWQKIDLDLPESLYFHTTGVTPGGYMHIFGGVHKDGFRSPKLYRVRLPLCVPKLSEMCWETVLDLVRRSNTVSRSCLTTLGIPWTFLERIDSG